MISFQFQIFIITISYVYLKQFFLAHISIQNLFAQYNVLCLLIVTNDKQKPDKIALIIQCISYYQRLLARNVIFYG